MKLGVFADEAVSGMSLPPRGAWIEIGRPLPGDRWRKGRSPHGERGLKFCPSRRGSLCFRSLPPRGAWIEIKIQTVTAIRYLVAPPTGSVD